jgi:hypothetical protein
MNSAARWFSRRTSLWLVFTPCLLCVTPRCTSAQQSTASSTQTRTEEFTVHRTWQIGAYGQGGFAAHYVVGNLDIIRYQKEQQFYSVTVEGGHMLSAIHGPGILKGRAEVLGEVTPFWLTHSPEQKNIVHSNNPFLNGGVATFAGYNLHGVSFTPLLFRWNFMNHASNRNVPWLQTGAGVLWTAHIFPQGGGYPGSYTSYFNFTPQLGVGEDLFVKKNQSLDIGMRVVQYNNAGLGEVNPGIPYTLNFSIGYSWWK